MISFNIPSNVGNEESYIREVFQSHKYTGNENFSNLCEELLKEITKSCVVKLTTSASHSLEVFSMLCDLEPGDEVIVPSFAFPTTASSFLKKGVRLVFVDVDPKTMNVSINAIREAVTNRTRVIVALHYAGISCDMNAIKKIAATKNIIVVEDAAQAILSTYEDKACGTIGDFGCYSFHQSKNLHCGEGGAVICNNLKHLEMLEMIIEKGTNRNMFSRGEVDVYTWQTIGSSYVLSELNAAFLYAQLEKRNEVIENRLAIWNQYANDLEELESCKLIQLPHVPEECKHNGHMFWLKTRNRSERNDLGKFLEENSIRVLTHYQPLHTSPAGLKWGRFSGVDKYTTSGANTLLRLPLYYGFGRASEVIEKIYEYYQVSMNM